MGACACACTRGVLAALKVECLFKSRNAFLFSGGGLGTSLLGFAVGAGVFGDF